MGADGTDVNDVRTEKPAQEVGSGAWPLGSLRMVFRSASQTPTKVMVRAELRDGDKLLTEVTFSDVPSSLRSAAKLVQKFAGYANVGLTARDVDMALSEAASYGKSWLESQECNAVGESMRRIVERRVESSHQFAYRSGHKLWSEKDGLEWSRGDFLASISQGLLDDCSEAFDVPKLRNGRVDSYTLQRRVEALMEVRWGTLLEELPTMEGVDLTAPATARRLRKCITTMWKKLDRCSHWRRDAQSSKLSYQKYSLAALAREWFASGAVVNGWHRLDRNLSAWAGTSRTESGIVRRLAMTYSLSEELDMPIVGCASNDDLLTRGHQSGAFLGVADEAAAFLPCGEPISLLAPDLTDDILYAPSDQVTLG